MRARSSALALTAAVAVALTPILGGCGATDHPGRSDTTGAATATAPATGPTSTTAPPGTVPASVYFLRGGSVIAAGRHVDADQAPEGAVAELLAGPITEGGPNHTDNSMDTAIPDGVELGSLHVADGTATVDLSSPFASPASATEIEARIAQVVFTLTQFTEIERVVLLVDGNAVEGFGPQDLTSSGADRADFPAVTPAILVESPTPHSVVSSSITLTGTVDPAHADLRYEVTVGDDEVLDEGPAEVADAVAADGPGLGFRVDADAGDYRGDLAVHVFEEGAEVGPDGSRPGEVRLPLTVA